MTAPLPFQTNARKSAFRLALLNPNDASLCGPAANAREPATVRGGILDGWNAEYVRVMKRPQPPLEGWEQVVWDERDQLFVAAALGCTTPEAVEAIMPAKWLPFTLDREVDERLARICSLCTALVNRYIAYEDPAGGPKTTAEWHEHQRLKDVIAQVLRVLEASVGDSLAPATLSDPEFLKRCWQALCEDDQNTLEALLDTREGSRP
jgi:hypothetical protein